jgi:hypothetical protein
MIKRVMLWVALTGFVGVLAAGAINRTAARSEAGEGTGGVRGQNGRSTAEVQADVIGGAGQTQGRGAGQGGRGAREAEAQAAPAEWLALRGSVAAVDEQALVISLADGSVVEVAGRAWDLAQEQGFEPGVGDALTLEGFYDEQGTLEAASITDVSTGLTVTLRQSSGRPLWAGAGGSQAGGVTDSGAGRGYAGGGH